MRGIFSGTGRAYLIGVTGPPGAGKSTLVDRLIADIRGRGDTVGVLTVDPTSPFTGGAVLGDRLRMQGHAADAGVFIRSMATRGHLGGLARATADAALVLDAAGKDIIIIETVGVGQDEVDIIRTADVSIVTLVPGAGDDVQALKAGIMEIADVFVVNKADTEGADRLVATIESSLSLQTVGPGPKPTPGGRPILKTIATSGMGVAEVVDTLWRFRAQSGPTEVARRLRRSEFRLRELVAQRFMDRLEREILKPGELAAMVDRIAAREIDPYTAADELVAAALPSLNALWSSDVRPFRSTNDRPDRWDMKATPRSHRHRGEGSRSRAPFLSRCARARDRSARGRAEPEGAGALRAGRTVESRTARGNVAGVANREVHREARPWHSITSRFASTTFTPRWPSSRPAAPASSTIEPRPGAEGALIAFIHPPARKACSSSSSSRQSPIESAISNQQSAIQRVRRSAISSSSRSATASSAWTAARCSA